MFNIAEFRKKPDRLTDLLPWAILVRSGIILNKDGSFMQTIKFRGPDLESSTNEQLVSATARLNNALKRLGSGWAIFIEARRTQALAYPNPKKANFPDLISRKIDDERRNFFESEQENFESHYYLTFQYLPPKEAISKSANLFIKNKKLNKYDYHKTLEFFRATVNRLYDILKDFMFEVEFLDDDATLTYLHSCISEKDHPIKTPDIPAYLDGILADTPLIGGLDPKLGKHYLRTISIMGFPSTSTPAILDQLNHLPIEYRWVTRFLPLDKIDAEKILKNYKRQWFSKRKGLLTLLSETISKSESAMVDSGAIRKSQDTDEALQELADDHVSFGYYTATVTIWDEDNQALYEKQREVERVINGLGFTTIAETINSLEAWLSSLPGHVVANVRMPLIHSLNLAHLIPFSAIWSGPTQNDHLGAPPLFYARTIGNTPFRFCNYIGDVGHEMIIGPTGSGKSVLMNLMATQFLRYKDAQVFIFDKGGSFMASTAGVGGIFYEVGATTKGGLIFQPLANIDKNSERVWAQDWICGLLENENLNITPEIKEAVWNSLTNLANSPVEQRTLTGFKAFVQHREIRLAIEPYVLGGPYGDILDATHEKFYDANWQCFEMEDIMQMPKIVAPVLSYIFHVLDKRFDGKPTLMILDEAWLFLDNPMFATKIRQWLKTLRKRNVSVIFATQSVDDALSSKIASALIESCPSRIFLPNDRALEPNIKKTYEQLGLNEKQILILANAIAKRQYYYESSKGNCLFDLNLGDLAFAFCAASTPADKKLIKKIKAKNLKNFNKEYLATKNLHLDEKH